MMQPVARLARGSSGEAGLIVADSPRLHAGAPQGQCEGAVSAVAAVEQHNPRGAATRARRRRNLRTAEREEERERTVGTKIW